MLIGRPPRLRRTSSARWTLDRDDELNAELRAWLPLDENGGTDAWDLARGHHGGLVNARARDAWKYGRAYACVSPNELVNVGGPSSLASTSLLGLDGRIGNYAVCGWVYLSGTSLSGAFFGLGSATTGVGLGVGTTTVDSAGGNIVGLYQNVRWVPTGYAFATGWHFVALSLNGSGHPTVWFDRAAVYSDTTGAPAALASGYCFVGTSQLGSRFFTGSVAHFRAFGRPLAFADVDRMVGDPWAGAIGVEDRTILFLRAGLPPFAAESTATLVITGGSSAALALAGASAATLAAAGSATVALALAGGSTATLAISGTATATLGLSAAGAATLALTGIATGTMLLAGASVATLAITGTATAVNPYVATLPPDGRSYTATLPARSYRAQLAARRYTATLPPRTYS